MRCITLLLFFSFSALAAPVSPLVRGLDRQGQTRACHPMSPEDVICTGEFTAGDQYAVDCVAQGGMAVACGCHDYLCILVTESKN